LAAHAENAGRANDAVLDRLLHLQEVDTEKN
jgi:hypothetical protein